ncbi:unnamed protein product [Cylicocyclus nassatus]|uniref:SCP domain-containing protein n=1 Tax=Cylicocyclus nassatus TaxID=53992 RepID=A0AA36HGM6_CYLNA|nr:unnamed protein product [Cylicocyclus nassatus]
MGSQERCGANTKCPRNLGMTDELRMNYLDMHNYRRSLLANGQVAKNTKNLLPQGANIMKLELNCDLEAGAIAYAKTCPYDVSSGGLRRGIGEHYHRVPVSDVATERDAIKSAVTNWWRVVRLYPGPGMEVTFRSKHVGTPIETFTQMAWADTRKLGCAVEACNTDYVVICRYYPKGNIIDRQIYTPEPPCTACSTNKCDDELGLCIE